MRDSLSSYSKQSLRVPKKDGIKRMYVNNIVINKIVVKCHYLIPRLDDIPDKLHGAIVLLKINLNNGCHHTQMKERDEWNT